MKLGREFWHLHDVAKEALKRGNPRIAERLFESYKGEAERLKAGTDYDGYMVARRKAQKVAQLLGKANGEAVEIDVASPYATVKKRRRSDPVSKMALQPHQIVAAEQIRDIFEALVRGLFPRVRPTNGIQVDTSKFSYDPFETMPDNLATMHGKAYLPWVENNQHTVGGMKVVDMVLGVLVDRRPLSEYASRLRVCRKTLGRELRYALNDYARRAQGVASPQ